MQGIQPTCRYGHGILERIDHAPSSHGRASWALMGTMETKFRAGTAVGKALSQIEPSGRSFTVATFRCPQCGYVELFDDFFVDGVDNG